MVALMSVLGVVLTAIALVAWYLARRERTAHRELDAQLRAVERERTKMLQRRRVELALEQALEHAQTEDEVIELVHRALVAIDPSRPFELHLVDQHEPVMRLVFATGATVSAGSDESSPWESVAARDGTTLVYRTTESDDVCPHLQSRLVEPCSAIAVPLLAMGRIVGLLYATGPRGAQPSPQLVETYEVIARAAAAHVAAVRGFAPLCPPPGVHPDDFEIDLDDITIDVDELTGLAGRADAVAHLDGRVTAAAPFSVMIFDIDAFGLYQSQHGAAAGDRALGTLGSLAARELGTSTSLFLVDSDRLLAVVDDATARDALHLADRLRQAIAGEVSDLPFTISFGVVEASRATSTDRVLFAVTDALYNARARGNDSTVLGLDTVVGSG